MNVVLFIGDKNAFESEKLEKTLGAAVEQQFFQTFHDMDIFSERLRQVPRRMDVLVFICATYVQLLELIAAKPFLENIFIILGLPDTKRKTISKGHLLAPRFIVYRKEDYGTIESVLAKMKTAFQKRNNANQNISGRSSSDRRGTP